MIRNQSISLSVHNAAICKMMSPFTKYICHFWILLKFKRERFNFVTDTGHSVSQFLPSTTAIKVEKC